MKGKTIWTLLLAAVLIGAVVLLIKLVGGAVTIVSGAFDTILGAVIIVALVLIVLWMFRYARRK